MKAERLALVVLVSATLVALPLLLSTSTFALVCVMNFVFVFGLWFMVTGTHRDGRAAAVLTPSGLAISYASVTTGVVPLLWAANWATPWAEVASSPLRAVGLTTLCLTVFAIAAAIAFRRVEAQVLPLITKPQNLSIALFVAAIVGALGYLLLAGLAGGPVALLHTLGDRRDLLAGTGPLRIFLNVAAVGCVAGVLHKDKSRMQTALTWACGLVFVSSSLLSGARFSVVTLIIAITIAAVRSGASPRRLLRRAIVLGILAAPASTFYGLKVRTGLTYGENVKVVDTTSTTSIIHSLVNPFVQGGLDTIRTTGVAGEQVATLRVDFTMALGSLANLVPRALWPGKPTGAATQFSQIYFPEKWADGTGVPPSLFAEFLHSFGLLGGLVVLALLGFGLVRFTLWVRSRRSLVWELLTPFVAANLIALMKGGSDNFVRAMAIYAAAGLIMWAIMSAAGTRLSSPIVASPTGRRVRSGAPAARLT